MRVSLIVAILAILASLSSALHEDEYKTDFFVREHIGTPVSSHIAADGAFVALTESNVVGAISPDGSLAWRRVLPEAETPVALVPHKKAVLTVSASPSATVLRLWYAEVGDLIWETEFTADGAAPGPCPAGALDVLFTGIDTDGDSFSELALVCGGRFSLLSGLTGRSLWSGPLAGAGPVTQAALTILASGAPAVALVAPNAPSALTVAFPTDPATAAASPSLSLALPSGARVRAVAAAGVVVVAALESPAAGATVLAAALPAAAPTTGAAAPALAPVLVPAPVPAELAAAAAAAPASVTLAAAAAAGTVTVIVPAAGAAALTTSTTAVGATLAPATVVLVGASAGAGAIVCAPAAAPAPTAPLRALAPPTHALAAPLLWADAAAPAAAAAAAPAAAAAAAQPLGAWAAGRGAATACAAAAASSAHGGRLLSVIFADGSAALVSLSPSAAGLTVEPLWSRDEGLAAIAAVRFVPLPAARGLHLGAETTSVAAAAAAAARAGPGAGAPHRDSFGLRQAIVAVTRRGVALCIDSLSGHTLWRRVLLPASADAAAAAVSVSDVHSALWAPEDLALVLSFAPQAAGAEAGAQASVCSVALRLNPWTGAALAAPAAAPLAAAAAGLACAPAWDSAAAASTLVALLPMRATTAVILPEAAAGASVDAAAEAAVAVGAGSTGAAAAHPARSLLLLVDASAAARAQTLPPAVVVAHPDARAPAAAVAAALARTPVVLTVADAARGHLSAWTLSAGGARLLWAHTVGAGAALAAVATAAAGEAVGSAVRIVGDHKGTLVKAVDRELVAAAIADDTGVELRLLRASTGVLIESQLLPGLAQPVRVAVSENSVVLTAWAPARGRHELTVVDLYAAPAAGAASGAAPAPAAVSQSFALPWAPRTLGFTATGHGLSSKDVLVASETGRLVALPRSLVDARRPLVPTQDDKEEGLVPYSPLLAVPPHAWLSLNHTLPRVSLVVAAPAALESTAIVASVGLDFFVRRTTPSGRFDVLAEDFDSFFLLVTVAAVVAATLFAWSRMNVRAVEKEWR
jgi:hypothetical protein